MKKLIVVIVFMILTGTLFAQKFHVGPFVGPSWYLELGTVGSREKEMGGDLGNFFRYMGVNPTFSFEQMKSGGMAVGVDIGYDLTHNMGIGANFILSLPFQMEVKSNKELDVSVLDDSETDSFAGFDMVIGPVILIKNNVRILTGLHLNTTTYKFRWKFYESGITLEETADMIYTGVGLGATVQGRHYFSSLVYGYANMLLGIDFFESLEYADSIKVTQSGISETISGSTKWMGGTFNIEITPVIGIGFSF